MNNFELKVIKGTEKIVLDEINEKFNGRFSNLKIEKGKIKFDSEIEDVDAFREIKSALFVTKNQGVTRNLYRRDWKKESVPASVNPALAYIMCKIAKIEEDDVIWDPFCGSGTIALSSLIYFKPKQVYASDILGKAVDTSIKNTKSADFEKNKLIIFRSDIKKATFKKGAINKIITNMPFGLRVGNHKQNTVIYDNFFKKALEVLNEKNLIVLLTQEKILVKDFSRKYKFEIFDEIIVHQGDLFPSIFLIKKT